MHKEEEPLSRAELIASLNAQTDARIQEVFPKGLEGVSDQVERVRSMSVLTDLMGTIHESMGITGEKETDLNKLEAQSFRISDLNAVFISLADHGTTFPINEESLQKFFETMRDDLTELRDSGSTDVNLGTDRDTDQPITPRQLLPIVNGAIAVIDGGGADRILNELVMRPMLGYAKELNDWQINKLLGPDTDEYWARRKLAMDSFMRSIQGLEGYEGPKGEVK